LLEKVQRNVNVKLSEVVWKVYCRALSHARDNFSLSNNFALEMQR